MDFSWSPSQIKLKQAAIEFAESTLAAGPLSGDSSPVFDRELWQQCADFGIQGSRIPEAYGGRDRDVLSTVLLMESIGFGCPDNGFTLGLNGHMWAVAEPVLSFGSEALKAKYLPGLANGQLIGAHGMTEPEAGSDAFSLRTTAEAQGDRYVLNGHKSYIGLAPICDVALIFANTNPARGKWGVSAFLVDARSDGFSVSEAQTKMGLSGSPLGEIHLAECEVPAENLLGKEGAGLSIFNHSMEWERSFIFASHVGAMGRQLETCIKYAGKRRQFDRTIDCFQSVSNRLADMQLRLETSRLLLYKAAWLKQQDESCVSHAAITKLHISESFVQSSLDAMRIHGAKGYLREFGVEKDLRDAAGGVLYSGTSDIQRQLIAALMKQ